MVEAAADALVVVDGDGRIVYANELAAELFGDPALVGRPVEELVPERFRERHRLHRIGFGEEPARRMMGDRVVDLRAQRADGTVVPVEIALSPVELDGRTHVVASVRDVRDRLALADEARRIAGTLDAVTDGVFMFDPVDLTFRWVNDGAVAQTGYTRHELLDGMTPLDIKPRFDEAGFRALIDPLLDGRERRVSFETVHRRRNGELTPVEIVLEQPADILVAISRDITQRRRTEEERDRREALLEALSRVRLAMVEQRPLTTVLADVAAVAAELTGAVVSFVLDADEMANEEMANEEMADEERGEGTLADRAWGAHSLQRTSDLGSESARWGAREAEISTVGDAVAVPVAGHRGPEAVLVLGRDRDVGPFDSDDIRAAVLLAAEAGICFDLARARQDAERLVVADDRARIARDLHDLVIQRLFAAGMRLQSAHGFPDVLAERADETVTELDETIAVIRQSIFELSRHASDVEAAVRHLVRQHRAGTGIEPAVVIDGPIEQLSPGRRDALLATLTEALANVARHAEASRVDVHLRIDDEIELTVADDGTGFDPQASRGFGLRNLAGRAEELGGALLLDSRTGGGTTLRWRVPS